MLSSYTSISFIRSFSDTVSFPPQAIVPATIKTIPKNIAYFLYSKSTQQYIIPCQDHYKHHNNRDCLLHQLPPGYPEIFRNDRKADVRRRNLHCRIRKCHHTRSPAPACGMLANASGIRSTIIEFAPLIIVPRNIMIPNAANCGIADPANKSGSFPIAPV